MFPVNLKWGVHNGSGIQSVSKNFKLSITSWIQNIIMWSWWPQNVHNPNCNAYFEIVCTSMCCNSSHQHKKIRSLVLLQWRWNKYFNRNGRDAVYCFQSVKYHQKLTSIEDRSTMASWPVVVITSILHYLWDSDGRENGSEEKNLNLIERFKFRKVSP